MLKINNLFANKIDNDGDVYGGSFTSNTGLTTMKYFYIISFKLGTQARGHEIADFKLFKMLDGKLVLIDDRELVDKALKEVLRGF